MERHLALWAWFLIGRHANHHSLSFFKIEIQRTLIENGFYTTYCASFGTFKIRGHDPLSPKAHRLVNKADT